MWLLRVNGCKKTPCSSHCLRFYGFHNSSPDSLTGLLASSMGLMGEDWVWIVMLHRFSVLVLFQFFQGFSDALDAVFDVFHRGGIAESLVGFGSEGYAGDYAGAAFEEDVFGEGHAVFQDFAVEGFAVVGAEVGECVEGAVWHVAFDAGKLVEGFYEGAAAFFEGFAHFFDFAGGVFDGFDGGELGEAGGVAGAVAL